MKTKIKIVPFEEYAACQFFTINIDDHEDSEFLKFSRDLVKNEKSDELGKISLLLGKIGENGGEERYFRAGGKRSDNLWELPDHYILKSKYRLYCLRYGTTVVILGNGGEKKTRTYQQDPILNDHVEILQAVDAVIRQMIKSGDIIFDGKKITGKLEFYI